MASAGPCGEAAAHQAPAGSRAASPISQIQRDAATIMQPYFTSNGLVTKALEHAFKLEHIMDLTRLRCLGSLFSMLHQACRNVAQYNANHPDFPMQVEQLERYIQVRVLGTCEDHTRGGCALFPQGGGQAFVQRGEVLCRPGSKRL